MFFSILNSEGSYVIDAVENLRVRMALRHGRCCQCEEMVGVIASNRNAGGLRRGSTLGVREETRWRWRRKAKTRKKRTEEEG